MLIKRIIIIRSACLATNKIAAFRLYRNISEILQVKVGDFDALGAK